MDFDKIRASVLVVGGLQYDYSYMSEKEYDQNPFIYLYCDDCKTATRVSTFYPYEAGGLLQFSGRCPSCDKIIHMSGVDVDLLNGAMNVPHFDIRRPFYHID